MTTTQAQHQKPTSAFESSHPSNPAIQTTITSALPTNPASLSSSHAMANTIQEKSAVFAEADLAQSDALKLQDLGWQLGRRGSPVTSSSEALQSSDDHLSQLSSSRQALQSFWARVADMSWVLSWHPWAVLYKQQPTPQQQLTHYKLYKPAAKSTLTQDLQQVSGR